jgi:hypothetical protein
MSLLTWADSIWQIAQCNFAVYNNSARTAHWRNLLLAHIQSQWMLHEVSQSAQNKTSLHHQEFIVAAVASSWALRALESPELQL